MKVKLLGVHLLAAGESLTLAPAGTPATGWAYEWFTGLVSLGHDFKVTVSPTADTVYKVVASKANCANVEAQTKVVMVEAKKK